MSKRTGSPVHIKGWYKKEKLLRKITLFFQDIKFARQRIKYGWCDRDTWDIDMWFLAVIPPMLEHLKNINHGYPAEMTEEEWHAILDRMIFLFHEAAKDEIDVKELNELYEKGDKQAWFEGCQKFWKYQDECKNEAFDLFKKWFRDLWD